MTFSEWQATKQQVGVKELSGLNIPYAHADDTERLWIYAGPLVIECRPGDRYLLQLPQEEEESEDLEPLERRLFEFGKGEGLIA